jgi:hypothetical protein
MKFYFHPDRVHGQPQLTESSSLVFQHANAATSSQTSVGGGSLSGGAPSGAHVPAHQHTTHHHVGAPILHSGTKFRHGLLQLMIHTIDPLHDGRLASRITPRGLRRRPWWSPWSPPGAAGPVPPD